MTFFLNIHFSAVLIIIICTKRPRHWFLRGHRGSQKSLCSSPDTTCSFRKLQDKAVLLLCAIYLFIFCCLHASLVTEMKCLCCVLLTTSPQLEKMGQWCRPWIFLLTILMYKGFIVPTLLSNKCFHTLVVFCFSSNLWSVSFWFSPKKSTGIKMFI